ncbi:DUF3224 domain-containing protein [Teredinibacter haidensis]|uniref:DUF3224 domain-containing protein n=1 Tax=Teredinibacter haidensis TaxID=2731755 RepID=UPI000948FC26|nr:DUF3224 domain-containing protein [Teredinibacter haidensis]
MELTGEFQITNWDEKVIHEYENGTKQSYVIVTQAYSGDICGLSEVHYLMYYQSEKNAVFVGHERIVLDSGKGTLVLQHEGVFENGIAKSEFTLANSEGEVTEHGVPATGAFESTAGGKAQYSIKLNA